MVDYNALTQAVIAGNAPGVQALIRQAVTDKDRGLGQRPTLATYDHRLAEAATAFEIPLVVL